MTDIPRNDVVHHYLSDPLEWFVAYSYLSHNSYLVRFLFGKNLLVVGIAEKRSWPGIVFPENTSPGRAVRLPVDQQTTYERRDGRLQDPEQGEVQLARNSKQRPLFFRWLCLCVEVIDEVHGAQLSVA